MNIRVAAAVLCACWWIAEYLRSSVRGRPNTSDLDKGSSRLWDVGHLIGVIGVIVGFTSRGRIRHRSEFVAISGFVCMLAGIYIRWLAIRTLGEYFTGKVAISPNQHLVEAGLYRHVRHPAYAGALLAYFGMGLAFANWISILLIFLPILLAALYRIRVEEAVLSGAFGDEYAKYSARTRHLVPWIY